jgi:hypothetical protein
MGTMGAAQEWERTLCLQFAGALDRLNYGDRDEAAAAFRSLFAERHDDGPTLFYLDRIRDGDVFPNDGMKVA